MIVRALSVDEIVQEPELHGLFAVYAQESSIAGLPPFNPDIEHYRKLEALDMMRLFAAYRDEILVGFLSMLISFAPHYGEKIAVAESFFVAPEHRKSGAGLSLLRAAEEAARALGAVGFFVSAPVGGKLAAVMEATPAYRETNRVFFRKLV